MGTSYSFAAQASGTTCGRLVLSLLMILAVWCAGCTSPTAPRRFAPRHPCNDCRTASDTSRTLDRTLDR
jgi:hypothetical protein